MEFYTIRNPADIALPEAKNLVFSGDLDSFEVSRREEDTLASLEEQAQAVSMLYQRYHVNSSNSIITPRMEGEDNLVAVEQLDDSIMFDGELFSYSTLRIDGIINPDGSMGRSAIRALCLAFHKVTLVRPELEKMPEDRILHTPAFAVTHIKQREQRSISY